MRHNKTVLVLFLTALALGLSVFFLKKGLNLNFQDIFDTVFQFPKSVLFVGLLGVLIQILFQVTRLWVLFARETGIPWAQAAKAFLFGQFLNTFVPARAGDVVKILISRKPLDSRGREIDGPEATGVILADKVVDTGSLVFLIFVGLLVNFSDFGGLGLEQKAKQIVVWALVVIAMTLPLYKAFQYASRKILGVLQKFLLGLSTLKHPRRIFLGVVCGTICWTAELVVIGQLCQGLNYSFSFTQLLMVLVVLNLGVAIPISLANVGTFEAAMSFGLTRLGVTTVDALAISTLHHALQMAGISLSALVAWLVSRSSFESEKLPTSHS